jgi:cell division protein FtsW
MTLLARTDRSLIGNWWWTVDRVLLAGVAVLAVIGIVLVLAASPPVGLRKYNDSMHFVVRHAAFMVPAALLLLGSSLLKPLGVLRLARGLFALFFVLLLLTFFVGIAKNGAQRWIGFGGLTLQPSEFLKPALAVLVAYVLARRPGLTGLPASAVLILPVIALLALQPDVGMAVVVAGVFAAQLFVAGLPWLAVFAMIGAAAMGLWSAYLFLPHFTARLDSFLDPTEPGYQVEQALRAVAAGGLFGRGPGEGIAKFRLPDAHADFIFAATAEEYGIIACLLLVALFAFVVGRGLWRIAGAHDRFIQLAATGLIVQLAVQAVINMAVNVNMVPTKGMTLPFISYGGSSTLALALAAGMLLALTRRNARFEEEAG